MSNTDHILGNESYDISTVYDEPKIFWKMMRCEILQDELANHNLVLPVKLHSSSKSCILRGNLLPIEWMSSKSEIYSSACFDTAVVIKMYWSVYQLQLPNCGSFYIMPFNPW
jgi:hypothetical protein